MKDDTDRRNGSESMSLPKDIPANEWAVYQRVLEAAQESGLRFALGGAFALATYTGHWRNTKDLDLFIVQQDRDAMVALLTQAGLQDYYDCEEYDRGWIYRAHHEDIIVDAIWSMANRRASVEDSWLTAGPTVTIRGLSLPIIPAEELIWCKLYILHRDRFDWTDVWNLIFAVGPSLNWEHLLHLLGNDAALLRGVLSVFTWICPGRSTELPSWLWERLYLPSPQQQSEPAIDPERVALLDTRPWFFALLKDGEVAPALE